MNFFIAVLTALFALTGFPVLPNAAIGGDESKLREVNSNNSAADTPNPYKGHTEASDPWQYDVFEISRGALKVEFDETLEYEREYSIIINPLEEEGGDILHEYRCHITLPQYTGNEPWTQSLNTYYQELMPQLAAEGDSLWDENIDDMYTKYLIYDYHSAYKYENIITVIRSRAFGGWRPSSDCNAFADIFSTLDGHVLSLDDLFIVDRDVYLPVLYSSLRNSTMCFSDGYDQEHIADFRPNGTTEHFEEASLAVSPFGLVFIYPTGCVSSMANGVTFLNVSYEDLKGLLNPQYFPEHAR